MTLAPRYHSCTDINRLGLRSIILKVDIAKLDQEIKEKNQVAGGISHIEFHHLANDNKKAGVQLKCYGHELKRNASNKRNLLNMESRP